MRGAATSAVQNNNKIQKKQIKKKQKE